MYVVFFCGGRSSNPNVAYYYILFIATELSSRRLMYVVYIDYIYNRRGCT